MYWITNLEGGPQRVNHAAVAIGSKIYSFGGYNSEGAFKFNMQIDIYVFDTDSLRWRPIHYFSTPAAPKKCYGHTVVAHGSRIYLWGGRNNLIASNSLFCFDTVSLAWVEVPVNGDVPRRVDGHSACVIGDEMYVFGGFEEESERFTNSVYCLDLYTFVWRKVEPEGDPPLSRDFHTASVIEDKMYIFGGRSSESETETRKEVYNNDIMYLDIKKNAWKKPYCKGTPPCGRRSHSAVVYKDEIYIIGGFDGGTKFHLNDIHKFNPESRVWTKMHPKGDPPLPRRRHCTCVVGDHLFLFGGSSPRDQNEYARQYLSDDASNYDLQMVDHSDTYILDFFPSLKRLCQLQIVKSMLRTDYLPQALVAEIELLSSNTTLSRSLFTIYSRRDFPAVGFSA